MRIDHLAQDVLDKSAYFSGIRPVQLKEHDLFDSAYLCTVHTRMRSCWSKRASQMTFREALNFFG